MIAEDRERIHKKAFEEQEKSVINGIKFEFNMIDFKAGAEYEHPIAYNRAIEDALKTIKKIASPDYGLFAEQLEKLKV